ncbi:SHOCT domain-containing protein [Tenacibaculum caenipelagi]|uniref:Putative membrane protein n=1 Tax=Tenacibaculum caenipelagi TaxID=1325435 RepID=A0A4V3D2Q1_9FLAO|nr:SHOCT domain-containing protein [Tenacibaculum caenipelagi]TDQ21950.1 putative membrane protein [Tenacibaculum caenipelagi]
MHYYRYYFDIHIIWWFLWIIFIICLFAVSYNLSFRKTKKDSPLDILKKRFSEGEISKEAYEEAKKILTPDK